MRSRWDNAEQSGSDTSQASHAERPSASPSLIGSIRRKDAAIRGSAPSFGKHSHSRLFDLIWLVYSAFFFIEPIERNTFSYWLQFAVAYGIFLALYVGLIRVRARTRAFVLLASMGVLGLVYYPLNLGASGIFIYVSAFAPFITDAIAPSIVAFVASSAGLMAEGMLLHLNPWSWGFPVFFSLAVGSANLVMAQRMRANQRLSLAQEEIAHLAKVAERERIARDLHDVLGHTLSLVVLKSELAGKLMERDPERARKEVADVEQIARTALGEVRQAIRGYRSEGLSAELEHARATLDAAGVTLECSTQLPQLRAAEETVISLIVREAVTNIVRHAQASHCHMSFEGNGNATFLTIEDDGCGGLRQEGNGLRGMRERVESLGGRFRIESQRGTRLVIEIPDGALREP